MKKILSVLIVVFIIVFMAGCNDDTVIRESYKLNDVFVGTGEENGFSYMVFEDHTEIIKYTTEERITMVEFPSLLGGKNVTAIGDYALSENAIVETVIIPSTVTDIGNGVFEGCTSLKSITIPKSVRKIGCRAFNGTPWYEGLTGDFVTVGDGVFIKYGGNGGEIVIPKKVKYISDAFLGNNKIYKITVPESVIGISAYAFYECGSLSEISIPDSMWDIGINILTGTTWFIAADEEFVTVGDSVLVKYNGDTTDVSVPEGIKYIAGAFTGNETLTSVTLPSSVVRVADGEFRGCTALKSATFNGNDTKIGSFTFMDCSSLTEVNLPEKLTVIASNLFNSCIKLESLVIPDTVKYIGNSAFYNGYRLKTVNIPDGVLEIGVCGFFGCPEIERIDLPDSIVRLGICAFACCYKLEEFTIPPAITEVSDALFSYCIKLKKIELSEKITSVGNTAFEGCDNIEVTVLNENTIFDKEAFADCEDTAKIIAKENSVAQIFASGKNIKFEILK
jgi:hypothetical protein